MFSSIPLKKENLVGSFSHKVFLTILFLSGLCYSFEINAQHSSDSLFVPSSPADLGAINEGDTLFKQFTVINLYSDTVIVHQVAGTCGCTVPKYEKQYLAPNDSMIISFTFNSNGLKHDVVKYIRVLSSKGMSLYEFKVFVKPKEE